MNTEKMIPVSEFASSVLAFLIKFLEDSYKKFDNGGPGIMPIVIEFLSSWENGEVYSFSHYFEMNMDLVPDPDMTFLKLGDKWFPMSYQDRFLYNEIDMENPDLEVQRNLVAFTDLWMKNIVWQQELPIDVPPEP